MSAMNYTTTITKKKIPWPNEVHLTLDTEADYYAATRHADVFAITDQEETIPLSLAVPAEQPAVPNAEQAETTSNIEEPTPSMPA